MNFLNSLSQRPISTNVLRLIVLSFFVFISLSLMSFYNSNNVDFVRLLYVFIFLVISVSPFLFMDKEKGRYLLMVVFLPLYYIYFFIGDLLNVAGIDGKALAESVEIQFRVDTIIAVGFFSYIFGYLGFLKSGIGKRGLGWFHAEWCYSRARTAGIVCYLVGTWAFITIFFFRENSTLPLSIVSNLKQLTLIGVLMLIYCYLSTKKKSTLFLLIFIGIFNFCLGFVANTKEVSFATPVLFLIMSFLSTGKINKTLTFSLLILMVLYTGYFNAYRLFVIQIPERTPLEAFQNFSRSFNTVIEKRHSKHEDNIKKPFSRLKERIDTRKYIVILVDGIEKGTRTMDGYTIGLFFKSFIPRVFWPEKPEISIGRLFNKEFKISSSPLTYVPATHIGEFYWNFKMPGVVVGMIMIGIFMACISTVSNLSVKTTLPRFIIIMMTIYIVCIRFEQDWAQQYSNVVRALVIVWFLNLFLRNPKVSRENALSETVFTK